METWIILALLSAITAWLANFWVKIIVEKWYNVYLFSFFGNALALIYLSAILFFQWTFFQVLDNINLSIASLAFINISLLIASVSTRTVSLRNIDTVIFYPIYKTLGPVIMTLVSIFYFKESLTYYEMTWIILGFLVPLMLITKKENIIQKNLFIWIIFILVTVLLTSVWMVMPKIIQVQELDINSFMFCAFWIWIIITWLLLFHERKMLQKKHKKWSLYFWVFFCSFHFWSMYFFTHALVWNLAIVFTINSFSILIPIILSIIFYKEHFNLKKWLVIALSIISILLFI